MVGVQGQVGLREDEMLGTRLWAAALACVLGTALATSAGASFVTFESGQTRPLALSPDGTRLFAINTPDNRLEIFDVTGGTLVHSESVPVGMEPVAVAARSNSEVWVVNHLSDSVSILDVSVSPAQVTRTLLVGDEPRDIVIANGTVGERVMITTARRGQNSANHSSDPVDPALTTPQVGRALVWVFDPGNLDTNLEGNPLSVVSLFGDTPRALTVSPDGNSVYAAVFHSGNQTTPIFEGVVCDGGSGASSCTFNGAFVPGGLPAPNTNFQSITGPEVGLIVKFDPVSGEWRDELDRDWSTVVPFSLPDLDVFEISTTSGALLDSFPGVGTINFNMVTNPSSGKVYVSNTEAVNEVRFEGHGTFAGPLKTPGEPATVRGHLHESRITVLDNGSITPIHLNKHIDYDVHPSPAGVKDDSLATPLGMAVSSDGNTLYVAAFGSSKVGVFDTTQLENDTFTPSSASHISVSGGGPSGVVLDETNARLYVMTRFDNSISVINTGTNLEIDHLPVYNPEPSNVVDGRPILYDAFNTSSNGEASCSSCHVFGDFDSLAWDLGDPDGTMLNNPNPFRLLGAADFHPMKGPMTTQSLRGMANNGPMHWRGDRTGGNDPGGDPLDEVQAFLKFNPAFGGLLGLGDPPNDEISPAEMLAFANFILDVVYPPNPIRALDNSLTAAEAAGESLYSGRVTDTFANCNGCHTLDPANGFFGGDGLSVVRGRDPGVQDPPPAQRVPEGRNVQPTGSASTRHRILARRQCRYGLQLPVVGGVHDQQPGAARSRGLDAGLRHHVCSGGRTADHPYLRQWRDRRPTDRFDDSACRHELRPGQHAGCQRVRAGGERCDRRRSTRRAVQSGQLDVRDRQNVGRSAHRCAASCFGNRRSDADLYLRTSGDRNSHGVGSRRRRFLRYRRSRRGFRSRRSGQHSRLAHQHADRDEPAFRDVHPNGDAGGYLDGDVPPDRNARGHRDLYGDSDVVAQQYPNAGGIGL